MPRQASKTFTDKELEIMRVIWDRGEATTKEIQEALPGERHYNSVLTIIRVLERKGHLTHRAEGKAHVYRAKAKPEKAQRRLRRLGGGDGPAPGRNGRSDRRGFE
jgi:BlaI family transcriptional regulator, penicillinase repressor